MTYTLVATGDLMLQHPVANAGSTRDPVWDLLATADGVFANVEVPLTDETAYADKVACLRADPVLAEELPRCGVTVVNGANNHALDYGLTGMLDTIAAVEGVGLPIVGIGTNLAHALTPAFVDHDGLRIAYLGMATTLPVGSGADERRGGMAPIHVTSQYVVDTVSTDECPGMSPYVETSSHPGDVEAVVDAIRRTKDEADVVVVAIHWGVPHGWLSPSQGVLATYQQPLGRALIDAGADVIIGHHPHVLQGIEMYRGRPIFYSLGNFLFHRHWPFVGAPKPYPPYRWDTITADITKFGGLARLRWSEGGAPDSVELDLVKLGDDGEPTLVRPDDAAMAVDRVAALSRELGTEVSVNEGNLVVTAAAPAVTGSMA
jgi:hypothetical protein